MCSVVQELLLLQSDGRGDRDGEDMWTQGLFISMYDKIHYKKKKKN